jgi:oligopeptide transport system substrate-binding protein
MALRRVGPGKVLVGTQFSRRDFLKLSGTGLAGAALLGTAGCGSIFGSQGGGGGGSGSKVLNVNLAAEIDDLNSSTTTDSVSFEVLVNTMEGLYRLDPHDEPIPAMAKGVEVSDDELSYTFTLRDGVMWSNGDPVTAEDFRYAWLKAMSPETASEYSYIIAPYVEGGAEYNAAEGGEGDVAIEAPDDKTLEVTLVAPSSFFLQLTTFPTYYPQQQAFVEKQGDDYAQDADSLLYNGPYIMTQGEISAGGTVVLKKNDRYWDKANVAIERINMQAIKEEDTALNLYEAGELDAARVTGTNVQKFQDRKDFERQVEPTTFFGLMNHDDPVISNLNIRKGLMIGFDKKVLAEQILADGSEPAYALVPPVITPGPGDQTFREANGNLVSPDAGEGRQFWEQGVQELGETPKITMLFGDDSISRDIATFIQDQYKKNLGADLEVQVLPFEAGLDKVDKQDYQISFVSGWGADYNDPMTFLDLFLSSTPIYQTGFKNERFDQLILDAKAETDQDKRMQMMLEAEQILFEDAVIVPEYYRTRAYLRKLYLKGYVSHSFGGEPAFKYASIEGK